MRPHDITDEIAALDAVPDGFAVYEQQHAIYDQFEDIRYFIDGAKFREMQRFELHPNDLIMSCSGTMGKVAIVPTNVRRGIINQALLKLTPSRAVLPEFLKYWMDSKDFQESLKEQSGGAAIQNVASVDILKQIRIPLPPLPEQQRIVGILDEAFATIATAKANTEKNLRNARALFESNLQSIFIQRGNRWNEKPLVDICAKVTDGEHLRPRIFPSGVPFLSAKDVLEHDVVFDDPLFVSEADAEKFRKRCNPEKGDILMVSRGATVGRTCIVKSNRLFCLLGSVILLKINEMASADFVTYALKCPAIKRQLMTVSEASAQQAIYLRDIKQVKIGVPPLADQRIIVSHLNTLASERGRLESLYQRKLAALDALKKSLLHQAFTGQLTARAGVMSDGTDTTTGLSQPFSRDAKRSAGRPVQHALRCASRLTGNGETPS